MMKRTALISALIALTALLAACTAAELTETASSARSTDAIVSSSAPSSSSVRSTTSAAETTDDAPTTVTTTSPYGSVIVTVEPEVVTPGQTYTGRAPLELLSLTVTDPDNKAGLDSARTDYSYGAAKDGKPHQVSVNHQAYFDSHGRVALTLDNLSAAAGEKVLYLTFDNGYEYEGLTGDILDVLKAKNVPATFFCTLDYLEDNPEFVVRMISEGHNVGNHSTTHPAMTELSRVEMAEELLGVENYLRVNYGYSSKYFRFPSGAYSDMALELVGSVGYRSVFWSNAHADWDTSAQPSVEKTFETITSRLHPGSVILLHAISQSNASALADIIDYARSEGYVFRSLDDYQGW